MKKLLSNSIIVICIILLMTSCEFTSKAHREKNLDKNNISTPIEDTKDAELASKSNSSAALSEEGIDEEDDSVKLEGAINKDTYIHMNFSNSQDKILGEYYYDEYKTKIKIDGKLVAGKSFTINEYAESGAVTGTFNGIFVTKDRIEGIWTDGVSEYSFYLENEDADLRLKDNMSNENHKIWEGNWNRINSGLYSQASIDIKHVTNSSLVFSIEAMSGANSGYLSGIALIKDNVAVFQGEAGEEIKFYKEYDKIEVEMNEETYAHVGLGVTFGGEYKLGPLEETALSLKDLGIVENEKQETVFLKLVAGDIGHFVRSAHLCFLEENLDGFDAEVKVFRVRGLPDYYTSIIMTDSKGKTWAATYDGDAIKYYTNDIASEDIPKTIKKWYENLDFKNIDANKIDVDKESDLPGRYGLFLEGLPNQYESILIGIEEFKRIATEDKKVNEELFDIYYKFYSSICPDEFPVEFSDEKYIGATIEFCEKVNPILIKYGKLATTTEDGLDIYESPSFIIDNFSSYLSDALIGFLKLRNKEIEEQGLALARDAALMITWDELGDRIVMWEKYMNEFPNYEKGVERAQEKIDLYLELYLNSYMDNTLTFNRNTKKLREEPKKSFERFIELHTDSRYHKLISEYYQLLKDNSFMMNDNIIKYLEENSIYS